MYWNRNGSTSVFAVMVASSMLVLMVVLVHFAREGATLTNAKALNKLWGQAILAEYDLNLKSDYGILAYKGNEALVESKLRLYAGYTYDEEKWVDWDVTSVDTTTFSLINLDRFKEQLVKSSKFQLAEDVKGTVLPGVNHKSSEVDQPEVVIASTDYECLPSGMADTGISMAKITEMAANLGNLRDLKNLVKEGSDKFFVHRYVYHKFGTYVKPRADRDAYLRNEQEYLICGKISDEKNRKALRNKIIAFQEVVNLAYLHAHPEKTAELDSLVGSMIPPPLSIAAREGLIAAWALAESVNDYQLLIRGKQIPLIKDESSWATGVATAVTGLGEGFIDNHVENGNKYEDYLKYMMCLLDEETLCFRVMDLVQLSMRQKYYSDFRIVDYNSGVSFTINVNGKDVTYEKSY